MKLNTTPRHYMPLSQSQSDDDESGPCKEENRKKIIFKNSFIASNESTKDSEHTENFERDAKNLPMSPLRKLSFIMSLITCILFIVIFVFLIPCTDPNSLNSMCHLTNRWKSVHQDMTSISPLDFVYSQISGNYIIILGYVSDESGIIAIEGPTGKERWRLSLHATPTSSICDGIDVNLDGHSECIIIGDNGLLTAVDPKKGSSLWYLHDHNNLPTIVSVDRPMLMPDCDDDGIEDLFIPSINIGDNVTYIALVSGGTGQIIGSLLEIPQCVEPVTAHFTWRVQNETDFVLYCKGKENNGNLWLISSKSVCEVASNETSRLVLENVFSVPKSVRDVHFYKLSSNDKYLVSVLDGKEIMLLEKSPFMFHTVWKVHLQDQRHIRVLADGQFSERSSQLVILSDYLSHAKVTGLSLRDGKEVWTFIQEKGNITSALKLPKFFADSDGLILKVISSLLTFSTQAEDKNLENNSTSSTEIKSKHKIIGSITHLREDYVLVKPEKIPVVTNLNTEEIWSFCEENVCKPDVFTPHPAALISTSEFGTSIDVLAVSSTLHPSNNSLSAKEEVFIKYWNLKNVCYISRCNS